MLWVAGCAARVPMMASAKPEDYWCVARQTPQPELSPVEHLMREHGLYERVLLIYEEAARRLDRGQELPDQIVPAAAHMVQRYLEEYHQDAEDKLVFVRFERAIDHVGLVRTLRGEHETARSITNDVLALAVAPPQDGVERARIAERLRRYVKLMRPHLAREDTELFPALHKLITAAESRALLELLEQRERDKFGDQGFANLVADIEVLEKKLAASRSDSQ